MQKRMDSEERNKKILTAIEKIERAGEIEIDDYGIATFKGFEEVFSDEKGTYGIIYKKI